MQEKATITQYKEMQKKQEVTTPEYNKHTNKIHTNLQFTLFDRDYLRSLGDRILRLEYENKILKEQLEQLQTKVMISVR